MIRIWCIPTSTYVDPLVEDCNALSGFAQGVADRLTATSKGFRAPAFGEN